MPSDVINNACISHSDMAKLMGLYRSLYLEGRLCLYVAPVPDELKTRYYETNDEDPVQKALKEKYGVATSLEYRWSRWGTASEIYDIQNLSVFEETIEINFFSASCPPREIYHELKKQDFAVKASWYNCADGGYLGSFDLDVETYHQLDHYYSDNIRDVIGPELDDLYEISKSMAKSEAEWEAENGYDDDEEDEQVDTVDDEEDEQVDTSSLMLKATSLKEAGNDHYKLGEWTSASNLYRQGIAIVEKLYDPNSADEQVKPLYLSLLTNLSMVCLKENKPTESRDIATQALSVDATNINIKALYRGAMAHRILGDMDNAKKDLKLALQYDPDNLDVKREWALTKQALANQKSKEKVLFKKVPIVLYSEKEKMVKDEPKLKIKRVPMFLHSDKVKLSKDESKLKCKSEWEAENSKRMSNGQQAVSFEDWEKQWKAEQEEHKYEPQPWKFENFDLQTSQSMRDVIGAQMDDQLGLSQFMAESGKGLQIAFVGDPSMRERIRDGKVQIRF